MQAALGVEARRTAVWAIAASQQRAAATSLGPLFGQPLRHRHPPPRDQDATAEVARGRVVLLTGEPLGLVGLALWGLVDEHCHVAHARVEQRVRVSHVLSQLLLVNGVEGGRAALDVVELLDVYVLLPLLAPLRQLLVLVLPGKPLDDGLDVAGAANDVICQAQHRADDSHVRRCPAGTLLHLVFQLGHRVLRRYRARR